MKRIIYTFLMGLVCAFTAIGQPYDLILNTAESGTQQHQAINNITLNPGYSYTPGSGTMLSEIIWQAISGNITYSPAIDPGTYAINTSLAVGKTPGNLSVGGSAGYNIPIEVPAGTNGMQPSVNLNYSSDFSNGVLGTGWGLGGLSSISRVNKTIYNDGKADAIRGDLTDKYALDGKRLVTLSGYTYGADNSLYGTELEEFSKIVSMGSSGTNQGPEYFIVYTKSGLIYEYGNTPDSKLKNGTCILKWKVNKITDRYNNYITFSYLSTDDELPVEKIEYTGNSSVSQSPFAQILFNYMYRDDITRYVYGGKEFTRNILLDNIEIKTNGLLFKKYGFDYTGDGYTYAQLQKVTEYSSQNQPLNPTVFAWTTQTEQFAQANFSASLDELVHIGDYNGDGRDDVVTTPNLASYTSADKWKLYLADASGTMVYTAQGDLNSSFETFKVRDFNGDGLTDLMMQEKDASLPNKKYFWFYPSSGSGLTRNTSSSYTCLDHTRMDIVDYNGDGKMEFLYYETSGAWYLYNYLGSSITSGSIPSFGKLLGSDKPQNRILDFNGDGCSDLLVLSLSNYKIYEFKGTNNTLIQTYTGNNIVSSDFLLFGDFNDDGGTDIIRSEPVPYPWYRLSLTSGGLQESFLDCFDFSTDFINNNRFYTRDMNADGKMDLVMVGKGFDAANPSNRINVAISAGPEFAITEYISSVAFNGPDQCFNFGDYDGDGRDQLFFKNASTSQLYSFASGTPSHLVGTIIDGLGAKTTLTYLPMSNSGVYTRGTGATYPVSDFSSASQLVSQATGDNGIGGTTSMSYQYAGAKIHREGKGFLCFSKVTATNGATGIFTESNYTCDGAYYYPQLQTVYTKRGSTTLSTTSNTWATPMVLDAATKRIFPYISTSTETDNLTGLNVATSVAFNSYGSPTSVSKNYGGTHVQTTTYAYNNELVSSWLIGRPTTITETSVRDSQTKTFTTTRTYFSTNNSPDIDQYNSGDGSWWQLNRDYDGFGNLWKEYKATTGLTEQTTVYTYWTNNVNVETVTGPDGNQTTYDYYPVTGRLHTVSDPFNNITTYNYDSNDQLSGTVPTEGVATTITRSLSVTGGPAYARYYVQQTGNDGSDTKTWYDKLGRELRTETKKMGGQYVKVDKEYNNKGQLYRVSEPTTATPSFWNILGYDDYGRTNSQDPHFGATTTIGYSNATVTRSVNGRNYTSVADAAGLITSRTDPGGSITYAYWPDGTLKSTLTPGSITTSMTYDKNGNRLSLTDPSAGVVANTWYGTGQPKTMQNGRGQTTTYTYQADGLLDYYTTSPADEGQTNYTYNDKKQVSSITSPGGVSRSYTYDTKGRVSTITESIDGASNVVTFEYDSKGRLYRKYFNGSSDYEQYDYDTNSGYLYRIQFNGATVWQLTTMDEYLRTRQATIGAITASWTYDSSKNMLSQIAATGVQQYDYSFDVNTGNLSSRTNYLKTKTESFGYDTDNLDRLTSVSGPVNLSLSYTTNKNGNIQTKGDAGTYAYDDTPYAVSSITNGQNISTTQQDVTYYSFGKVKQITEGTKTAEFVYNADHQRVRMVLKTSGTATKTRWYFGGSCERELVGGVTTQYIWIGGDAYTAVAVAKKVGTGSWTVYNIFRDHLGTITHLKNGSNPADEYSFDAWGRRRDKDDWTMTLTSEPALFADRGFTGHEYLEDFNLYNMNGRLYDPVAGRFLNADPVIQDAGFSQNYNRYSYCLNNPLKYTDPSGNQIAPRQYREEGPDRASGGGGGFYGNGLLTPHLDQARELNMAQDASGGWRYDSGSNGYYNLFSYETGWGAASDPIASYGASLPVNIDIPTISFGRKGRLNGVWYQTVSLKGNYKDWVDGVKSPGAYVNVINKFRAIDPQSGGGRFPLAERVNSYLEYPGRFGDPRDGGSRKHGGADLYAPVGANVYAVEDGTVIKSPYAFNTKFDFAIEINHGGFIGRYCEINIVSGLHSGSIITQGQLIGTIAKMPGYKQTMLHFEMYSGNATGPLTNKANPPYMRRSDLIDPTHFLNFGY